MKPHTDDGDTDDSADDLGVEWCVTLLMTEGHQQLVHLLDMFVDDLLMWASAIQAVVNEKNNLLAEAAK